MKATLERLVAYRAWANAIIYADVLDIPAAATEQRGPTRWESIAYTLSHVWTVDDIFRHHLLGKPHSYTQRNLDNRLNVCELSDKQTEMDRWLAGYLANLCPENLGETVHFTFVGGGEGAMSRQDIILHCVNHATYHRGLVSAMLYEHGVSPRANDYTVFLRDIA